MESLQTIMNTRFKLLKNQKGLTLVELLAVIVILGVISAIAVPAIGGIITNSKINADAQTETLIKDAAVQYLTATNATTGTSVSVTTLVTNGYLKEAPTKQSASVATTYSGVTVSYSSTSGWAASAVTTTP
jgi:type IV pilus assembly protein PilA